MKGKEAMAIFKAEFERCCEQLSLTDWDCTIKHKRMKDAEAEIDPDVPAHMVTIRLDTSRDMPEQKWRINAKHEAFHLLTATLKWMAESRFVTEDELDREWERLAVIGEKLMIARW